MRNGMFIHCFGPRPGFRHDFTLYELLDVGSQPPLVLNQDNRDYFMFGESGYNAQWFLEFHFPEENLNNKQCAFNKGMTAGSIIEEWIFNDVKNYWKAVDFKRKMCVLESPVGAMYKAAILLTNIRASIYLN